MFGVDRLHYSLATHLDLAADVWVTLIEQLPYVRQGSTIPPHS